MRLPNQFSATGSSKLRRAEEYRTGFAGIVADSDDIVKLTPANSSMCLERWPPISMPSSFITAMASGRTMLRCDTGALHPEQISSVVA